jgi:hypothetical protein
MLLAQLLAQAIIVNYVVDKNPKDTLKFRITDMNKKLNTKKKSKNFTEPTKFNFLHLKLTISVLKSIKLLQNRKNNYFNFSIFTFNFS